MKYEELENKILNLLIELEEVSEELNNIEAGFEDVGTYFRQAKEVENTISNLQKLNVPVPAELQQLKLSIVSKKNEIEKIKYLRQEFEKGIEFFETSTTKKRDTSGTKNYQASEFTGKRIVSATIFDVEYSNLTYWKDLVVLTCELMYDLHKDRYEKIFDIKGKKRKYFSKDDKGLKSAKFIEKAQMYCETNLSAADCIKISKKILEKFEHNPDELEITYEDY